MRKDKDIERILLKLESHAVKYPGFVSAENRVSQKDISVAATVSAWGALENCKIWQESRVTQELLRQDGALLIEEPRMTTYGIVPAVEWL